MIARKAFVAVIGGVEVAFKAGDTITAAQAKEAGLKCKPDLVEVPVVKSRKS